MQNAREWATCKGELSYIHHPAWSFCQQLAQSKVSNISNDNDNDLPKQGFTQVIGLTPSWRQQGDQPRDLCSWW